MSSFSFPHFGQNILFQARQTPLLSRGGVAARLRKSCEATLARADGVVLINRMILLISPTPAAATASAFPSSAEEGSFRARFKVTPIRTRTGRRFARHGGSLRS